MVELQPSKLEVAGSRPVFRSKSLKILDKDFKTKRLNEKLEITLCGARIYQNLLCDFDDFWKSPKNEGLFVLKRVNNVLC